MFLRMPRRRGIGRSSRFDLECKLRDPAQPERIWGREEARSWGDALRRSGFHGENRRTLVSTSAGAGPGRLLKGSFRWVGSAAHERKLGTRPVFSRVAGTKISRRKGLAYVKARLSAKDCKGLRNRVPSMVSHQVQYHRVDRARYPASVECFRRRLLRPLARRSKLSGPG